MALILIRGANNYNLSNSYFPHDNKYPAIFQASSDEAANHVDFKFIFELEDSTGLVATYETSPSIGSYGTFDANMYIKNKLRNQEYKNTVNTEFALVYEYRVTVKEWYDGTTHDTKVFNKSLMSERKDNITRGQLLIPFKDVEPLILTEGMNKTIRQSVNTTAMAYIINWNNNDDIRYYVTYANGVIWEFKYQPTASYSFSSDTGSTISPATNSGYTVPFGYKDLLTVQLEGVQYYDGSWHTDGNTHNGILDITNATTPVKTKIYPYLHNDVAVTIVYENCNLDTLHWRNNYGGYDHFNVNTIKVETVKDDKEIYQSNSFNINLFPDPNVADKRVIVSNEVYNIKVHTNYLTDDEMDYLKSLFTSDKIYYNNYPVILTENSVIAKDTRNELTQLELNLIYAVN